jgi:PKD repeat protein
MGRASRRSRRVRTRIVGRNIRFRTVLEVESLERRDLMASATFVGADAATQGKWTGTYGADGYDVIGGAASLPSYAAVTPSGALGWTWAASTTDPRAPQAAPGSSAGVAACLYSPSSFSVNVDLTDGQAHQVSIYALDWDSLGRSERVDVLDAASGKVLDSETASSFSGGEYLTWTLSGDVVLRFTDVAGPNAVLSGLYFSPAATATFVGTDAATQGKWTGTYGADGYDVIGGAASLPSYAAVTPSGALGWTWAASTTDPRAPQAAPGSSAGVAACLYSPSSFSVNVDLTDGQAHQVSIYALDWDSLGRSERVDVLDAASGKVLDSETASSFSGGEYLTWTLSGDVVLRFTDVAGPNAVLSGLYFGGASQTRGAPLAAGANGPYTTSAGQSLTLTGSASGGTAPYTYAWDLTDTDQYNTPGQAVTDTMATAGTYVVGLEVTDAAGHTATTTATVTATGVAPTATATFVSSDAVTQGKWTGTYGADGYDVIGGAASLPSYAAVTPSGALGWTWAASTTDPRAPQAAPGSSAGVAALLYSPSSFSVNVDLTDGRAHQVSVYVLDWDDLGRSERVDVLDAASGKVLDSETASSFSGGEYLTWTLSGDVVLRFTDVAGPNAVLSGLFFGGFWDGPPSASILPPYNVTAGFATLFEGTGLDSNQAEINAGLTFDWSFGDGTTATGLNLSAPSHTYASAGAYTVQLTVVNQKGEYGAASLPVVVGSSSVANPLDKPVVNSSDFTYLGSFLLPTSAGGVDTSGSMGGLTYRYVNGQLQFLTTSSVLDGGLVYEMNYPGIGQGSNLPQAQVVTNWGDVYTGQKALQDLQVGGNDWTSQLSSGSLTYGLYYDQASNRLYWTYGDWYNAAFPNNPSIGYSVLNDATGTATGMGAWSLTDRPEKFDRGGVLSIPQWFADEYTGGDTLGVGFGGYFSIADSASFGPALAAIAPPDPAADPDDSSLPNVPLVGYPSDEPARADRDPNYTSYYDGGTYPTTPGAWNPSNGVGSWTWSDSIFDGATWVDTPQLGGVLYIAKVGQGNVWYQNSDRHAQGSAFEWMVYSPKDLAAVASGAEQQWQIQPEYEWTTPTLPVGLEDQFGYSGDGYSQVGGVTFDPTTDRLYVLVNGAYQDGTEYYPEMYVYQVGAPNAPTAALPAVISGSAQPTSAVALQVGVPNIPTATAQPAAVMTAGALQASAMDPAVISGMAWPSSAVVQSDGVDDPVQFDATVIALDERRGILQDGDQDNDHAETLLSY